MRKFISVLCLILIIISMVCGCALKSDEELIEERMNTFIKAYNAGDIDAVLECVDAKTRNTYKAVMNIGNSLIGLSGFQVSISDIFSLGVGIMSDGDILRCDNMDISLDSDRTATVRATIHYQDYEGSYSDTVNFTLVKENGQWYLCG